MNNGTSQTPDTLPLPLHCGAEQNGMSHVVGSNVKSHGVESNVMSHVVESNVMNCSTCQL
jgi:hypothetical protein